MSEKTSTTYGIGSVPFLTITLVILKALGYISWSWLWVFVFIWGPLALLLGFLFIAGVIAVLAAMVS